jgi:hypothetical protein
MNDKRGRLFLPAIDKKDDELATTFICSMMWAGTLRLSIPSHLQIKGPHNTEADTSQLFFDPRFSLVVVLIES